MSRRLEIRPRRGLPVVYVDIDGTMTHSRRRGWGRPKAQVILKVRDLIARGYVVYVWTGGGAEYARRFCARHGLAGVAGYLPKPNVIVDDNPNLLPARRLGRLSPEEFAEEEFPWEEA